MISKLKPNLRLPFHCWATVIPGMSWLVNVIEIGFESLFQYELVKLKVGTKSTCVYRDYSGGVELMGIFSWRAVIVVDDRQFWRMMCCSRMIGW